MLKMLFGIINVANCAKGSVLAPLFSLLSRDVGRSESLVGLRPGGGASYNVWAKNLGE